MLNEQYSTEKRNLHKLHEFHVSNNDNLELSRKVEPENTQNITAAIFADGVERSGTESANFGGYAASPRAASRNCSGGSPSGFDVYTLKRL